MAAYYTTKDGDRIDRICWEHYGHLDRAVEQVWEANFLLSEYGIHLPADVQIMLPEIEDPALPRDLGLWGV